jgi:hypothetical protein
VGEAGRRGRLVVLCLLWRRRLARSGIWRRSGRGELGIVGRLGGGWTKILNWGLVWIGRVLVVGTGSADRELENRGLGGRSRILLGLLCVVYLN